MPYQTIDIFQNMISSLHIHNTFLLANYSNAPMTDISLRKKLYENFDYKKIFKDISQRISDNEVLQLYDNFCLYYFIIKIPKKFVLKTYLPYVVIGPILNNESGTSFIKTVLNDNALPEKFLEDFREYYNKINFTADIEALAKWILSFSESFFQNTFKLKQFSINSEQNSGLVYNNNPGIAIKSIEERYDMEEAFLHEISCGNFTKALSMYNNFRNYKLEQRSKSLLWDAQYLAATLNTLCRKTLQYRNKVHPYYLDAISAEMSIAISGTLNIHEVNEVSRKFIKKYCLLAMNHSLHQYSDIVNKAVSYIELNYTGDLSLSLLANKFHVNKNYLSSAFKKQMGNTVTEFIHNIRIDRAIFLLNSTNLPINSIAPLCGYSDSNYFCRIFKKINSISPGQYRENLLKN